MTPGRPGRLTPATSKPGAEMATWYQAERSGSATGATLASIDPPLATLGPFNAQAAPAPSPPALATGSAVAAASAAAAARATDREAVTADPAKAFFGTAVVFAPAPPVPAARAPAAPAPAQAPASGVTPSARYDPGSYTS